MTPYPHWFEAKPGILEDEQREYETEGIDFTLNQELLDTRRVVSFSGYVKVAGRDLMLEVVYPPGYPFIRPEIYSRDTSLLRHQNPLGKNLCVLPNEEDEWDWTTMSGAFMVKQALRLLEDSFSGSGAVAVNEVVAPEPQITWLGHLFSGALVIPEQFQQIPKGSSGNFTIQAFSLEPIRALLSDASVHVRGDTTTIVAHQRLRDLYQEGISLRGAWLKADGMPGPDQTKDFRSLRGWALGQKSLEALQRKNRKQRVKDLEEFELIGVVLTDEGPERGMSHDTWVVLVSWRNPRRGSRTERVIRPAPLSELDRFSRAPQLKALSKKSMMIVGLGAIGSTVAVQLARAGIGRLHLLDYDVVEPANIVRHEADLMDVGREKTEVVRARVAKASPFTEVTHGNLQIGKLNPLQTDVYANAEHLQKLAEYVASFDLVIAATGGLSHVFNRIGLHAACPVIFTWVSNGAWGGRVLRMIPGLTGCYECLARNLPAVEPNSDPDSPAVYTRGCGFPSFTGTGFDIASISLLATRLAVQTVLRDEAEAYPTTIFDHLVWQNRGQKSGAFPELAQYEIVRQEGCGACGA